jgi:hypothetical protein
MWQAEVLLRQGAWCRQFQTSTQATDWVEDRIQAERGTVNPVRDSAIHDLSGRVHRDPVPPNRNADQLLTDEEFWA